MVFKKLHLEREFYGSDSFPTIQSLLRIAYSRKMAETVNPKNRYEASRRSDVAQVKNAVEAIALCHTVTPCYEGDEVSW